MNAPEKYTQVMQRFDTIYALRTPIFTDNPQLCGVTLNFAGLVSDKSEDNLKVYYMAPENEVILVTDNDHVANSLCDLVLGTRNYKTGNLQNYTFFFNVNDLPPQSEDENYFYLAHLVDLETTIIARNANTLERWIHKIRKLMHKLKALD